MYTILKNISNTATKDIPKVGKYEDIENMTTMEKSSDVRITTISYMWNKTDKKIVKKQVNKSLKTGVEKNSERLFDVKFDVEDDDMPIKEIVKKIKLNLKSGYKFKNVEDIEIIYDSKNTPFKNILEWTTKDFDIDKDPEQSFYYVCKGVDPLIDTYREMPIKNEIYDKVCGFVIDGEFKAFDLNLKNDVKIYYEYCVRYETLKDINSKGLWKVLDMIKVEGQIPKNVEDVKFFDIVNSGEVDSCIIIGNVENVNMYFYMYKIKSIFPKITMSGNSKGEPISSGQYSYIGFFDKITNMEVKVKTSIKSIVKNSSSILGLNVLVYYTDKHDTVYFINNVDSCVTKQH